MRSGLVCLVAAVLLFPFLGYSQDKPAPKTAEGTAEKKDQLRQPGFVFVELYTQDMPGYIAFFQDVAGFKLIRKEGTFAELRSERAEVLLNGAKEHGAGHPFQGKLTGRGQGLGVEIGLVVADLDKTFKAAEKATGWTISAGIMKRPWGVRDFRMLSPDGYYIRFTEPSS